MADFEGSEAPKVRIHMVSLFKRDKPRLKQAILRFSDLFEA